MLFGSGLPTFRSESVSLLVNRSITFTIERNVGSVGRFTGRTKKYGDQHGGVGGACVCEVILFVGRITPEDGGTTFFRNVGYN